MLEVNVANPKPKRYSRKLASYGVTGIELTVSKDMVMERIERVSQDRNLPIRELVYGAIAHVLLVGTMENRRWLGAPVKSIVSPIIGHRTD